MFDVGQKVQDFVGKQGLVVSTRVSVTDILVSWDDKKDGRYWCSSLALVECAELASDTP